MHFINADLIAAGLAPLAPERELLAASRLVQLLRQQGWRVELIFLALPSAEMSALRVAERVAHGGHSIPQPAIRRRFPRSLRHLLHEFSHRVDRCTCFMNHAARPVLVFEQNGLTRTIPAGISCCYARPRHDNNQHPPPRPAPQTTAASCWKPLASPSPRLWTPNGGWVTTP